MFDCLDMVFLTISWAPSTLQQHPHCSILNDSRELPEAAFHGLVDGLAEHELLVKVFFPRGTITFQLCEDFT